MTPHALFPSTSTEAGRGRSTRRARLAVFGIAAVVAVSPALIGVGVANAAPLPVVTITTPATGATGVAQVAPNVVAFAGGNVPTGDYASVSYTDLAGGVHNATFGGSSDDGGGAWSGAETFDQLSVGQTTITAIVTAKNVDTDAVDANVTPGTTTFTLAVAPKPATPFAITSPVSNSTTPVASTKPTFSGTGLPGATITIVYGARAGQNLVAATTTVTAAGTWSTPTDFSLLEPGQTDGTAVVTETQNGAVVPGTSPTGVNFVFPSAPAPLIPVTLTTDPKSSTLTSATTKGVAFAATGFSPDEEVTVAVKDPSGATIALPKAEAHFFADTTTGSFIGAILLPTTSGTGTYTVTVTGLRTARAATGTFVVVADPVTTSPSGPVGTLPVVSG